MSKKRMTPENRKQVVKLYTENNYTLSELAYMYCTSTRTIGRILDNAGVARPYALAKGKAYRALQILNKYNISLDELDALLRAQQAIEDAKGSRPAVAALLRAPEATHE